MDYAYVRAAEFRVPLHIYCEFEDGRTGLLDLTRFKDRAGAFRRLADAAYAAQVRVVEGVLTWGAGELDLAPESVYHEATGAQLPDWMQVRAD